MTVGNIMKAREELDMLLWREFQDGLTILLDVPIGLYDRNGSLLIPASKESSMCSAAAGHEKTAALCAEQCRDAIACAIEKKQIYIYKCHANQHVFAVPVFPDASVAFVIVGGKVYLEGGDPLQGGGLKDFYRAAADFGFDDDSVKKIKEGIKVASSKSVSALPGIVSGIAAPFLKCLYAKSDHVISAGAADTHWFKGFYALEQVYKSIAPLFDKEEIYDSVLLSCMDIVGAERGSLMLLDNKSNVLSIKASRGLDRDVLDNISIHLGEGIAGGVAAKGEPVMVEDIEHEVMEHRNMPWYKTKSFISMPLRLDNRVIGVINISDKLTGGVFSKEDLLLVKSIANYASIALERGAYYSMSEELKLLSMTDALTGLFNRRYFLERLFEEVERVKRHNEKFSLFILDIDNFKAFNDRYGHSVGDEILKLASKIIRDAVRSIDVVARYGGEEFVVLLPHTSKGESLVIAERIRRGIEEMKQAGAVFRGLNPLKGTPTISVGIAEFPGDAETIDDLVEHADKAMYAAKRMGRNRVVMYQG
ncbi:MAG: diguanylate cyclase [Deltaproteobacteria bacterium]|nr:diguanylate cyclase [Deltaproteobacteria bacterium]